MGLGDVLEVYQLNHETVVYTEVSAIFHPLMGLSLKRGSLPSNSGCDSRISTLIIQKIARTIHSFQMVSIHRD